MTRTLLALLLLSSCQPKILKVVSANFAKEYCSCLFVEKQSSTYCRDYAKQLISIDSLERTENLIRVRAFDFESEASFISPQMGCKLTSHPEG
jgi:hypothetical protein